MAEHSHKKVLGKTERKGKFGKISLMVQRNLSCTVIWIEFIYNWKIPALTQGLVLLKAQLV